MGEAPEELGHTAGPWTPCFSRWDGEIVGFHIAAGPHGSTKPICESDARAEPETLGANARLIAAAPDMHEAIEQALDDMGADGHCVCEQAKQMLRAAITKAEGR